MADGTTFTAVLFLWGTGLAFMAWLLLLIWEADLPGRIRRWKGYRRIRRDVRRFKQTRRYREIFGNWS